MIRGPEITSVARTRSRSREAAALIRMLVALQHALVPAVPDCSFAASRPREYAALKVTEPPFPLDGDLSKPVWAEVPWTEDFVDISTTTTPRLRTRAKIRWDEKYLYVAAELRDPDLWATLKEHNTVIFADNDFEIFVDPNATNHFYKEYEMNAFNANWDLELSRPYGDGGGEISCRSTPTKRPCFDEMHATPPLASAVRLDGTINNPATRNVGWAVEVALPVDGANGLLANNSGANKRPRAGVFWRINFSRVQWALQVVNGSYVKKPSCQSCPVPGGPHEDNWVWSPQGAINMHQPETWAILQLAEAGTPLREYDEAPIPPPPPPAHACAARLPTPRSSRAVAHARARVGAVQRRAALSGRPRQTLHGEHRGARPAHRPARPAQRVCRRRRRDPRRAERHQLHGQPRERRAARARRHDHRPALHDGGVTVERRPGSRLGRLLRHSSCTYCRACVAC